MSTETPARVRVVLADTRRLMREGLRGLLAAESDFDVVAIGDLNGADLEADGCDVVVRGQQPGPRLVSRPEVCLAHATDVPDLVRAIRAALGDLTLSTRKESDNANSVELARPLTEREQEVLCAVSEGRSAAQIAVILGISRRTVEQHKRSVILKLGVPNQARAVSKSIELRLLDRDF